MTAELLTEPAPRDGVRLRVRGARRTVRRWRRWRWWILSGALALVTLLGIEGFRYATAALALRSARDQVETAHQLLAGDLNHLSAARISAAQQDLQTAAYDFGPASRLLADGWLAQIGMHLPWIGEQINGADALRSAGSTGTTLALDVVRLASDVVSAGSGARAGSPLQRIVTVVDEHRDQVRRTVTDLVAFQQSLQAVPAHSLFGPLESARRAVLAYGNELTAGAGPALTILNALPAAIGPGTHRYLVLLENPGEERPAGGYIGAVGVVTFTDGRLAGLTFQDSAQYPPPNPPLPIPDPLNRYLFQGVPLSLEDANWSPDFPTAMKEVESFYTANTGQGVDGDISIDPVAIEYMLQLLGPVSVPPFPQVITSANALTELNYITNKARPGDPGKSFLAPFGALVTQDVLQSQVSQLPGLAATLQRAAREKHVVAYFHDGGLERLLAAAGLDGAVHPTASDSVLVDDANLSGTKGDLFVKRRYQLDVRVGPDGNATDQLTLTYTNPVITDSADRALEPGSGGQYRDYVTVLLPETGQVQSIRSSLDGSASQPLAPDSIAYQFEQQLVGIWFVVPAGATEQITLTYKGPFADISVNPERYQLTWLKQVNALDWPVAVSVHMPGGRAWHWSTPLSTDRAWSVSG